MAGHHTTTPKSSPTIYRDTDATQDFRKSARNHVMPDRIILIRKSCCPLFANTFSEHPTRCSIREDDGYQSPKSRRILYGSQHFLPSHVTRFGIRCLHDGRPKSYTSRRYPLRRIPGLVRTLVRVRSATSVLSYDRTHITNIVSLPDGEKYALNVAFGGDGPTIPLPLNDRRLSFENLGTQEVRLIYDCIDKQHSGSGKLWIYQYRNGAHLEWNSYYSFAEIEFFQEDFEVMNWWAVSKTVHRQNVIAVRFLGTGDSVLFVEGTRRFKSDDEIMIVGKVMLVRRTTVVRRLKTEGERVAAINDYFGIRLTDEEQRAIREWDTSLAWMD